MQFGRRTVVATCAAAMLAFCAAASASADPASSLTPQQAQQIAVDAYIYGYSLVTSEITRMATTNTVAVDMKTFQAPLGQIISLPGYPPADYKGVTAPNADTLYSFGFFDISKQPWVLSYPNMGTRYFLFPIYDEWTNVIGAPGARTYGYGAQSVAITGPGWHGTLPSGVTQQIKSTTGIIFTIGRVYAQDTPADLTAVHALQAQFKWVPLSSFGKPYTPKPGQAGGPYTPAQKVRDIIDAMSTSQYFNFMAKAMAVNPPILPQDAPIVAKMTKIGLIPGQPFDIKKLSPQAQSALADVGKIATAKIAALQKTAGKVVNGWVIPGASGSYGSNYLLRAYTSYFGWGANLSLDANYPNTKVDSEGKPLVGTNAYKMHFAKDATPPVNGFWSITMYDSEYFFYPNPLNKLTVSLRNHPKFNADGSLDLYFSNVQPSGVPQANWLPAPKGQFILMMRMYWPKPNPPSILPPTDPTWVPPPVTSMR